MLHVLRVLRWGSKVYAATGEAKIKKVIVNSLSLQQ